MRTLRGGAFWNYQCAGRGCATVSRHGFRVAKRRDILQVIRSGSWSIGADYCWAALRGSIESVNRYDKLGFRIARRKP